MYNYIYLPCMFRPWDGTLEHAKPPAELMGQWAAKAAQEKGWAAHRIWGWGRAPGGAALHMPCFRFVLSASRGRGLASAPSAVHLPALCWSMARSLLPLRGQVGGARSELQSLRGRGLASAPSADLPALCRSPARSPLPLRGQVGGARAQASLLE